eukprot:CAMPEP_0202892114 /NCGR_PEP_ID=MMETSP1392-20130828/1935_1 /ASSEMBLY_ACC=CAM_ASM_000868 /TAXON_ID=225041 /ORGANISM="Chlamydomonas chlamydogama, Strain SAG 11-48b" /LENGTH=845 /DNA_ID=CAMNT_0049575995 /DNA_START=38 /DNA_END=2572 /DNA_ORIENTATION=+
MADQDDVNDLDMLQQVSEDEGDDVVRDEEEEEGEDLLENMERDYRENSALDRYEAEGLDEDAEEVLDEGDLMAARRAAEEELDARDGVMGRGGRALPRALGEDDDDEPRRRRRMSFSQGMSEEPAVQVNIEDVRGRISEWIAQEQVAGEVKRRFRHFLKTFEDGLGERYYVQRIKDMQSNSKKSLEVQYNHLSGTHPVLAIWLADSPRLVLELFDAAARDVVLEMFEGTEEAYAAMGSEYEVHVRMANLPICDKLRDLRNYHLNGLVRVTGVVTRRTGVFPQLRVVKYDCAKCGYVLGPFTQTGEQEIKPNTCPNCSSKGPFMVNSAETIYRDFQKLTLQESPGTVPAGRLPRHKEVILLHDLIDCARPGEEVDITGMYVYGYDASLNIKNSFPVFSTHIEANHVAKKEDLFSIYSLTDEDKTAIHALAKDPTIGQRIIRSIAPSIYGHEFIKTGLAMALFGGQEKHPSPAYRLRGDINVLLLGDPGVAKSQFLKYVEKTAMRAVYTTGKGASAVGLTASVHRDPITKEWTLEGGALVLADKGVCLIDEFDKMNDQDRVSIHEAMEQQSISISKAGIVTQLQARCSVIAAANPIGGRYDPSKTLAENVELSDPILSRFDVMCVVRDQVDPIQDQRLAEFVIGNHMRSHPDREDGAGDNMPGPQNDPDIIPQDLLRKYITYSKQNCKPQLQQADYDRLMEVYSRLRAEASRTHGMPIAVRHLESLIRMSEAHARMHLREYVSDDDINVAIRQMVGSFIQTQKYSVHKTLEKRFKRFLTYGTDFHQLLLSLLKGLLQEVQRDVRLQGLMLHEEETYKISVRSLEDKAREHEIYDLKDFYGSNLFKGA